jgi:hypothetical protein
MRFRLGLVTGFATGYYLGSRAGRQRYDQINRTLFRLKRSEVFEQAAEQVKAVVGEGVEKARSVVESRGENGHGDGQMPATSVAVTDETATPATPAAPPLTPPPTPGPTGVGSTVVPPAEAQSTGPTVIPPAGDDPDAASGQAGPKGLGGYSSSR